VFWTKGTVGLILPGAYWLLAPIARATQGHRDIVVAQF
jgi:hypothetical protein